MQTGRFSGNAATELPFARNTIGGCRIYAFAQQIRKGCSPYLYTMKLLSQHVEKIVALCKKHLVVELYAFGSVVKDELNAESDIDLIVHFGKVSLEDYADNYFDLCDALETLLGRKVDLVVDKTIKNPYFREEVEETKQLLFAA